MLRPPSASAAVLVAVLVLASATTAGVAATDARPTASKTLDSTDAPVAANASVDAWRVPAHVDPGNASIESLREHASERADPTPVTPSDRLLVEVRVPGLDAAVANASGNATSDASTTTVVDDPNPVPGFGLPAALAAVGATLLVIGRRIR